MPPWPQVTSCEGIKDLEEMRHHLMEQFPDAADVDSPLSPIRGGRSAAESRLNEFYARQYERWRNFLDGKVSGLSPYVRHSVLTLAEVREFIAGKFGPNRLFIGKDIEAGHTLA